MNRAITVGELVAVLQQIDQNLPVYLWQNDYEQVGGVQESFDATGDICGDGPNLRFAEIVTLYYADRGRLRRTPQ